MIVSNSDRNMFKNCRRKWDLGSPNRQNLRVKRKQEALWLGSLVHNCLENFYGGLFENTVEAFQAEVESLSELESAMYAKEIELSRVMLEHYALIYPSRDAEPFEVICTEMPFKIPLTDTDVFAGTIDGVVRMKDTGTVRILEHKTFSMAKDPRLHGIDDQTSIYPPALNILIKEGMVPGTTPDDFCDGVIYNGLWKKVPSEVVFNLNGTISAKSLKNTTVPWLKHSTKLLGKKFSLKVDKVEQLEHNVNKFFPRFYIHRGEREQKIAINRLLGEFSEMKREDLVLYHNPSTECTWKCPFLPVCEAMNSGQDTEGIIELLYERAPSRGAAYE